VVLGHTRDEARLWFTTGAMRASRDFADVEAEVVRFAGSHDGARLSTFYRERFPDADPVASREKFLSDAVYVLPAWRTARAHVGAGGEAYFYRFDWTPVGENARLGAALGFDEAFVWVAADAEHFPPSAGDPSTREVAAAMSGALIDFARVGSPGWASIKDASAMRLFGEPGVSIAALDESLWQAWRGVERR